MLAVKPLPVFSILDNHLSRKAPSFTLAAHESLSLSSDSSLVTVVRNGTLKIVRAPDNILLGITPVPLIIGLHNLNEVANADYELTAITPCEIYQLEATECWAILDRNQLWKEAFQWVSWQCRVLEARDIQLVGQNTYSQIRATLQLMANWDPALRAKVGVINYIQQRTHISRSVIAEVLSALRIGNYIEMAKGKLVSVNRLPLEY